MNSRNHRENAKETAHGERKVFMVCIKQRLGMVLRNRWFYREGSGWNVIWMNSRNYGGNAEGTAHGGYRVFLWCVLNSVLEWCCGIRDFVEPVFYGVRRTES